MMNWHCEYRIHSVILTTEASLAAPVVGRGPLLGVQRSGWSRQNAALNISSLGTKPVLFKSCLTTWPPLPWTYNKVL